MPTDRAVRWTDVEELPPAGGARFVRYGDSVHLVDTSPLTPEAVARPPDPGVLRIASHVVEVIEGTRHERTETWAARRVADSIYADMLAADARRARKNAPKPVRPVDRLAGHRILNGRSGTVLTTAQGLAGYADGSPPIAGIANVIRRIERQGIVLTVTSGGRLLVSAPGGRALDDVVELVKTLERAIVATKLGHPLRCDLDHAGERPPATSIAAVDVPVCDEHLAGKLPAVTESSAA